jgi:acetylornithine deacetylase/succinyl-diaminopimelate desuccinylase-like protein
MPGIDVGVAAEDAAIHAPNENLRLDLFQKGMLWVADTMERFSS